MKTCSLLWDACSAQRQCDDHQACRGSKSRSAERHMTEGYELDLDGVLGDARSTTMVLSLRCPRWHAVTCRPYPYGLVFLGAGVPLDRVAACTVAFVWKRKDIQKSRTSSMDKPSLFGSLERQDGS